MILNISCDISTSAIPGFISHINNQIFWFLTPESDPENHSSNPDIIKFMCADVVFNKSESEIIQFLVSQGYTEIFDSESACDESDTLPVSEFIPEFFQSYQE